MDLGKLYQVRRLGKDLDDIYWQFGKIHGLENVRYLTDDQIAKITNPIELQDAINNCVGAKVAGTPEENASRLQEALAMYKQKVDDMG